MKSIDFSHSFAIWLTQQEASYGRFAIEAACILKNKHTLEEEPFYLCSPVMAGNVYSEGALFKKPAYAYQWCVSPTRHIITRHYVDAKQQADSYEAHSERFRSVDIHATYQSATTVESLADLKDACLSPVSINAHLHIEGGDAGFSYDLIIPVKHINMTEGDEQFQVETGPVVLPRMTKLEKEEVDPYLFMSTAFVNFNTWDCAEFAYRQSVPIEGGCTHSYEDTYVSKARIQLVTLTH